MDNEEIERLTAENRRLDELLHKAIAELSTHYKAMQPDELYNLFWDERLEDSTEQTSKEFMEQYAEDHKDSMKRLALK